MGEGSHSVSGLYVCMCVSSSDFPPPPHLSFPPVISLSSHLLHPSVYFLLCSSLLAGSGEHQLLHYIEGESSPTLHIHTVTLLPPRKSYSDLAILDEQANGVLFHALHPVLFFRLMQMTWVRLQQDFPKRKYRLMVD